MKLGIIGLGIAGKALLENAHKAGYTQIFSYDSKKANNTLTKDKKVDVICLSAGIDLQSTLDPLIQHFAQHHNIVNDIELFYRHRAPLTIAVTGSYGKSSVVHYIQQLLPNSICVGNIGYPIWNYFDQAKDKVFILEVSSYQLEKLNSLKAKVGIITNIYEHHLQRHKTFENYKKLKEKLLDMSEITIDNRILQLTNLELAYKALEKLEIIPENVDTKRLEHRREIITNRKELCIINDSKSTGPEATEYALKELLKELNKEDRIVLICGGKLDETANWKCIAQLIYKVSKLILFGQAREYLSEILINYYKNEKFIEDSKTGEIVQKETLQEVVEEIKISLNNPYQQSSVKTYILFSPGCQSFDCFVNFEERGLLFKSLLKDY